jgi:hypothetical protein
MGDVLYPTDDAILTHLCEAIERIRSKGSGPPTEPPSRDQIARMLSVAFAASLESEEGRKVTFNIFFTREAYPMNYRFRERAPLSSGSLVRLSAALDAARSNIAIVASGETLDVGGTWHSGSGEVGLFAIRVVGPGVMVVKYGAWLVLTYRRGQFVPYGDFNAVNDAGAILQVPSPSYPEDDGRRNHAVVCRYRIVEEMLRIGHGGTLLIVPQEAAWRGEVRAEGFPPAAPEGRIQKVEEGAYVMWIRRQRAYEALAASDVEVARLGQAARTEHAGRLLGGYEIRKDLAAELDALARLTATDGMVLIHPDLTLIGFGVFFKLGEPACKIESHDPYERMIRPIAELSELGGARHQSAAIAAARIPGALAIVASSDGSLTVMRRENGTSPLVDHRHLELRLPPWPVYQ